MQGAIQEKPTRWSVPFMQIFGTLFDIVERRHTTVLSHFLISNKFSRVRQVLCPRTVSLGLQRSAIHRGRALDRIVACQSLLHATTKARWCSRWCRDDTLLLSSRQHDLQCARTTHMIADLSVLERDGMAYRSLQLFGAMVSGGLQVTVRDVMPEDSDLIGLGFDRLSKQSRLFRFMTAKKRLTGQELEQFSALNIVDHAAFGALHMSESEAHPAGIARYIRTHEDGDAAEIAVTVVDAYQKRGIGTLLLGVLAKTASANGITEFLALVAKENHAMRHLLHELGGTEETPEEPEINIVLPIYQDPVSYPENKIGGYIRQAYSQAELVAM